jgi:hypothetical protein
VSPVAAAFVVASLAALAAAGVVAGVLRRDPIPIEGPGDPLEDRRAALLRAIDDLEDARATGALEDTEYERLRRDSDDRLARVLGRSNATHACASGAAGRRWKSTEAVASAQRVPPGRSRCSSGPSPRWWSPLVRTRRRRVQAIPALG